MVTFWEWSGTLSWYCQFIIFVYSPVVDWHEKWKWNWENELWYSVGKIQITPSNDTVPISVCCDGSMLSTEYYCSSLCTKLIALQCSSLSNKIWGGGDSLIWWYEIRDMCCNSPQSTYRLRFVIFICTVHFCRTSIVVRKLGLEICHLCMKCLTKHRKWQHQCRLRQSGDDVQLVRLLLYYDLYMC